MILLAQFLTTPGGHFRFAEADIEAFENAEAAS